MWRFLAGALACFLFMTGAFLLWQGHAEEPPQLPPPPPPARTSAPSIVAKPLPKPPEATEKSREEKRFSRADRDDDGLIKLDELLEPRRKSYAKLDKDKDGRLSFEEWAHTTIDKFNGADANRNRSLTRTEYATTAPPPRKPKKCSC
ncbi:MAG TPA: hypothetical protein VFP53_03940 [Sphingomicrobium sp.]|nr:hypothetical protein [Sphingomicrobium sp.]